MDTLKQNLPHLIVVVVVIAAACILAIKGVITGGEAVGIIGTAAGFSLGVGGASTSLSTAANAMPGVSLSTGTSTTTVTPAAHTTPVAPTPTSNDNNVPA